MSADHARVRVSHKNLNVKLQSAQTYTQLKIRSKLKSQEDKINGDMCQVSTCGQILVPVPVHFPYENSISLVQLDKERYTTQLCLWPIFMNPYWRSKG